MTSVALLLHGKIGGMMLPASQARGGSAEVVQSAHASLRERVLRANPHVRFDGFCHSWNPELGRLIDALYRPVWSLHEPPRLDAASASQALSFATALRAKRQRDPRRKA